MSTQAQITANRLNAQSSTGPKSSIGKAIVARNNLRHGFTGAFLVLHWEEESEYQSLFASLQSEHQPITPTEKLLVERMAQSEWLRKRAVFLQATCFDYTSPSCQGQEKQLALYLRYQTTQERAFSKALNELLRLRAEKRKVEIGFESQQRQREEHARKQAVENRKQEHHPLDLLFAEAKIDHQLLLSMECQNWDSSKSRVFQKLLKAEKAA